MRYRSPGALATLALLLAPALADDRLYRVGAALEALLEARWGGPLLTHDKLDEAVRR